MNTLSISIPITVCQYSELSEAEQSLIAHAERVTTQAYAPYSNFWVGCVLLLEDGTIVEGTNQENAAYPSGLCAERTAFFGYGTSHATKKIIAVAIAARRASTPLFLPITPCGACRQVMIEYENRQKQPIQLYMNAGKGNIYVVSSVGDLLPVKFDADSL